jgi:hypothetical protein
VFKKFLELGSVRQTLVWFTQNDLQLPALTIRGETCWRRPAYQNIHHILTNPRYGGAYAYGRRENITSYQEGASKQSTRRRPRDQWVALIPGAHEGYVSWEEFERIQKIIVGNRYRGCEPAGAPRQGEALLPGLLRCRRCARMLHVRYTGNDGTVIRYACNRAHLGEKELRCVAFSGAMVDSAVAAQVLRVVQPAALEAAIVASQQHERMRSEVLEALSRDLEAARYRARRAEQQYEATDPHNRLVAQELERRWNVALQEVHALEQRIAEERACDPPDCTAGPREFETLAADLESVWNDPNADERTKKRILRSLIREVLVDIDETSSEIVLLIHWNGGVHTPLRLPRRRPGQSGKHTSKDIVEAVRILARICGDEMIAGVLSRAQLRTGHGNCWTRALVTALRNKHGIPCHSAQRQAADGWLTLSQAAQILGLARHTVRVAIERGEISAEHPIASGPWALNKQTLQSEATVRLLERVRLGKIRPAAPSSAQTTLDLSTT